jgi:hypothetical protein
MLNFFAMDFVPLACLARLLNHVARATTSIARRLHLLEDAWGEHLFDDFHSSAIADVTAHHILGILGAGARAVFTNDVFLDLDLDGAAGVENWEGQLDNCLHIWAFTSALVMESSSLSSTMLAYL